MGGFVREACDTSTGGTCLKEPYWHRWGFGHAIGEGQFDGGIFMASNLSDTTQVYNVRSSAATNAILSTHQMATSSSGKRMIKTSRRLPVCLRSRVSPTRRYPERSRVPESSRLVLLSVDRAGMVQ